MATTPARPPISAPILQRVGSFYGTRAGRWLVRIVLALLALLLVLAALTYWLVPDIARSVAEKQIHAVLGRRASIAKIEINPFTLALTVHQFKLYEADEASVAASVETLFVDASASSLLRAAPVLEAVRVVHPVLRATRYEPQRFSFSDIIEKLRAAPKNASSTTPQFLLNNIEIDDGEIDFDDRVVQQHYKVDALHLNIPFISDFPSLAEQLIEPAFSARINGSPIALKGQAKLFAPTREATLELNIDQLDLPLYAGFSPVPLNFKVASGKLDTKLQLGFHRSSTDAGPEITLSGPITLSDVKLTDLHNAPALGWHKLGLEIGKISLGGVQQGVQVQIKNLEIDAPDVNLKRSRDGLDLPHILALAKPAGEVEHQAENKAENKTENKTDHKEKPPAAKAAESHEPEVEIAALALNGGTLHYADSTTPAAFQTTLDGIRIKLSDFSLHGKKPAKISISLHDASGGSLEHEGELFLSSHEAKGSINIHQARIPAYAAYYQQYTGALIDSAVLDGSARYESNFSGGAESNFKLDELALTVSQLRTRLNSDKTALFSATKLALEGGHFNQAQHRFDMDAIRASAPQVAVTRSAQGIWNVLLAAVPRDAKGSAAPAKPVPAKPAPAKAGAAAPASTPPTVVNIGKIIIDGGVLSYNDAQPSVPVAVLADKLNLTLANITTAPGAAKIGVDLATNINGQGRLTLKGTVQPAPLNVNAVVDAKGISLIALQGYLADQININFSSADLSTHGTIKLAQSTAPGALKIAYNGNGSLNNVVALDKVTEDEFLHFGALNIGAIDVQVPGANLPMALTLGDIALSDLYARVILNADGHMNLQDVMASSRQSVTQPSAAPATPAVPVAHTDQPKPQLRIGPMTLVSGTIDFTDNFIKPNYSASLTELSGAVSLIAANTLSTVNLRGSIDSDGTLQIDAKLNPLAATSNTDISVAAHGIELTRLTPYAAKYAGYAIEKGKLSMDAHYQINNGELQAQNRLFLDQLTFGERIESPTATHLPVQLAVALLKNSRGEIDINLPVAGSLSDPEFSIGGVISRVILNLLERAVTSPFSLLASVFGGGDEELSYVEFEPGSATLGPASSARLKTLVKALADRPALKVDITGRADPKLDIEGLRRTRLAEQVKAQKFRTLLAQGGQDLDPASVSVDASEYPKYLAKVYDQAKFPKPRNLIGIAKALPVEEMEKLLLANSVISSDDLRQLAEQRAGAVREYFESDGKIALDRLFQITPKLDSEGIKDGKTTRADLTLK